MLTPVIAFIALVLMPSSHAEASSRYRVYVCEHPQLKFKYTASPTNGEVFKEDQDGNVYQQWEGLSVKTAPGLMVMFNPENNTVIMTLTSANGVMTATHAKTGNLTLRCHQEYDTRKY